MSDLLKNTAYKAQLLLMLAANFAMFWCAFNTGALFDGNWIALATNWHRALVPGIGLIATGALAAVFGHETKARLVFWRWTDPLPACRAFTGIMTRDSRIDSDNLTRKHGPFPTEPVRQNAAWYRLYKTVEKQPEVRHVHRDYLLHRDYACLALLLLVLLGPAAFVLFPSWQPAAAICALFLGEYLLFRKAAASHGERFVGTVLALKATEA